MEILKNDILQLNFHTFIGSWAQFEELYEHFVNLGVHLPPKHNSPILKLGLKDINDTILKNIYILNIQVKGKITFFTLHFLIIFSYFLKTILKNNYINM